MGPSSLLALSLPVKTTCTRMNSFESFPMVLSFGDGWGESRHRMPLDRAANTN
jgi:hypothetical protein